MLQIGYYWIAGYSNMSDHRPLYMRNKAFMKAMQPDTGKNFLRPVTKAVAAMGIVLSLSACAADITKHGHVFTNEDLAQVKEGMSRDQVILALGTPDTKSTIDQNAFYYISKHINKSSIGIPSKSFITGNLMKADYRCII